MASVITAQEPKLYIGLDIHKKSWKVHFCTDLFDGSTLSFAPSAEALYKYVSRHYHAHQVSCVYEAGCCGYSAARQFEYFGWESLVVNPSDIPRNLKSRTIKTDKTDCINMARQLKHGSLSSIHIPDIEREHGRSLYRRRIALVKDLRRSKGRTKAMLLYYGIEIPVQYDNPNWSHAFVDWLTELDWPYASSREAFHSMIDHYRYIDKEVRIVSNSVRKWCRQHCKEDYMLLRSVPGIGGLTAAGLLLEIGDLRRFNSFKQLASYIGLTPGIHQSGESTRITGLTVRGHKTMRSYLIESAWVAVRYDPVLQTYYRKHAGRNSKCVIVKVARKLLSRIHAVIKSGVPYEIGVIQ